MAWTNAPAPYATGHLVTAAEWNTHVFDNPEYLKGRAAGDIEFERSISSDTDETDNCGSAAKRWAEGHFDKMFVSNAKFRAHRYIREQVILWDDIDPASYQLATDNGGGGDRNPGGTNQWVLKVQENSADSIYYANQAEQNSAFDTSFAVGRSPYARFEFEVDTNDSWLTVWMGFRQIVALTVPSAAAENYAGLHFDGTNWNAENADGSSESQSGNLTVAAGQRHVYEVLIVESGNVLHFVDGVLVYTGAANQPTGDLDWQFLIISDSTGGGATFTYVTMCPFIFQEDLA